MPYLQHGRRHAVGGSDPIPGASGIQFDIANIGDWLDVQTTDTGGGGWGIRLWSQGDGGFGIFDTDAGITIEELGAGLLQIIGGTGGVLISEGTGAGGISIENLGDAPLYLQAAGTGGMELEDDAHGSSGIDIFSRFSGISLTASRDGDSGDLSLDAINGNILMASLPTSDPGVSGALWNLAGIMQISP